VAKDHGEAARLTRSAADHSTHPDAQHHLAMMLFKGEGMPADPGEAALM
jgi:TPR repeat protein